MKFCLFVKSLFFILVLLFIKGDASAQIISSGDIFTHVSFGMTGKCRGCPGVSYFNNDVSNRSSRSGKHSKNEVTFFKAKSYSIEVIRDDVDQLRAYLANDFGVRVSISNISLNEVDVIRLNQLLEKATKEEITTFDFKSRGKFEFADAESSTSVCDGKISGTINGLWVTIFTTCSDQVSSDVSKPQMNNSKSMKEKGMKIKEH